MSLDEAHSLVSEYLSHKKKEENLWRNQHIRMQRIKSYRIHWKSVNWLVSRVSNDSNSLSLQGSEKLNHMSLDAI